MLVDSDAALLGLKLEAAAGPGNMEVEIVAMDMSQQVEQSSSAVA